MVDEQRIDPGHDAAFAGAEIAVEDRVHVECGPALWIEAAYGHAGGPAATRTVGAALMWNEMIIFYAELEYLSGNCPI
jgi:hypothetical protein